MRGIRRYGPGKYNTKIDSYVDQLVGEGQGEGSMGSVSEVGFCSEGILLGPDSLKEIKRAAEDAEDALTPEEADLIKDSHAAIVTENEQGFVAVDYYSPDEKEDYEKDLQEIEDEASGDGEEGDDEEPEDDEGEEEGEEGDEGEEEDEEAAE